jgi:hypothetical protein
MQHEISDIKKMDDPLLLAERRRVRELLEHAPETGSLELAGLYDALTAEFYRRASVEWGKASA